MLKDEVVSLNKQFLEQSYHVRDMFHKCITGLMNRDIEVLRDVIETDEPEVNHTEIKIEKMCINLLGLHQPAAKDLREIVMILKINDDLERIADIVSNIAESGMKILPEANALQKIDIKKMADGTYQMLVDVIKSYIENNPKLATKICKSDDVIDRMRDTNLELIMKDMIANPTSIEIDLHLLRISKSLERIADHVTNIAEDVVYIENAKIIKHHLN
ncbi:MAG: phosphate signaling complex protein PhoU [Calditrichaeota bacterium]|nr:phosphate signaling complex protein PhoU [Calditrichota bacterium]